MNETQIRQGLEALREEKRKRGITAPSWLAEEIRDYEAQLQQCQFGELHDEGTYWERAEQRLRVSFYKAVGWGFLLVFGAYALAQNF